MKIKLFSATSCPYCKMLKDYFISRSLAFEEKLVDQDETAKVEMSQVSGGFLGVPFTVVTKDNGEVITIVGFDKGKLDTILPISISEYQ